MQVLLRARLGTRPAHTLTVQTPSATEQVEFAATCSQSVARSLTGATASDHRLLPGHGLHVATQQQQQQWSMWSVQGPDAKAADMSQSQGPYHDGFLLTLVSGSFHEAFMCADGDEGNTTAAALQEHTVFQEGRSCRQNACVNISW